MYFCVNSLDTCKLGIIKNEWVVNQVLLEKQHGVIIMSIKGNNVMFISDFQR